MRTFFCPDQLLHQPQQFMRLGRLHKPTDVPARAEVLPCPAPSLVAQTGWFVSDLACPIGPHTWRAVLRAAHTAFAAAQAVSQGERLAYALCRPSGHHAHADRAGGFCCVNNSAVAAQHLAQHFGRVAVLDVDAHHGDGTQNIFYERGDVLTVSTHAELLAALDQAQQAIERFAPRALVLAMGFDTFRDDPISVLRVDHDGYRAVRRVVQ